MNIDFTFYVNEYIMLCSQLCKKAEDYTKEKVRKHNKAIKKLIALREALRSDITTAEQVYRILLNSDDSYVKQDAATECLIIGLHIGRSIEILEYICKYSDRMSAMGAERNLKVYRGEIGQDAPF